MIEDSTNKLIVILGPTATGKTSLAIQLATKLKGEVISADSRQVFKRMDIGTGKDLNEYACKNGKVPYHLIDIKDPEEDYDVFHFQKDFYQCYKDILSRGNTPILCGGSGMYIEAALRDKQYLAVPENKELRKELDQLDLSQLRDRLVKMKKALHNTTDLLDRERLTRAIEIAELEKTETVVDSPVKDFVIFGLNMEREALRERIKERLDARFEAGMIKEVSDLLASGVPKEKLEFFGLEYRYIVQYLNEEIEYEEMYDSLLQSIRRFAKKQMTWFRRMEKQGYVINWIETSWDPQKKLDYILSKL